MSRAESTAAPEFSSTAPAAIKSLYVSTVLNFSMKGVAMDDKPIILDLAIVNKYFDELRYHFNRAVDRLREEGYEEFEKEMFQAMVILVNSLATDTHSLQMKVSKVNYFLNKFLGVEN